MLRVVDTYIVSAGTFFKTRKEKLERRIVIRLLKKTGGNIRQAALLIDERRSRLYRILQRHGLKASEFRIVRNDGDSSR